MAGNKHSIMAGTNDDSESDLELARAIALSLAEDNSNAGNQVIELSSDESDDDGDLARAIALSLKQPCSATKSNATKASSDEDDDDDLNRTPKYRPRKETEAEGKGSRSEVPNEPSDLPQTRVVLPLQSSETPGLHTWDRKADEEARLARLAAKRKALDSKQESQGRESKSRTRQTSQSVRDTQIRATQCPKLKRLWCPRGVVKKTFVQGLPRTDDDISIDEIFQKDELELAVLSSFQWDERWMFTKIDPKKTQVCLVAFANSEKQVRITITVTDSTLIMRLARGDETKRP